MSDPLHIASPLDNMGRKPAAPLGSPAMVQHLMFWIPKQDVAHREAWIKHIERVVIELDKTIPIQSRSQDEVFILRNRYKTGGDGMVDESTAAPISQDPTRYETVTLQGLWKSIPLNITVKLHNEYFTITLAVDMANGKAPSPDPTDSKHAQELALSFTTLNQSLQTRFEAIQTQDTRVDRSADRESLMPTFATFYYDIWDAIGNELLIPALERGSHPDPEHVGDAPPMIAVGDTKSDFRGLILSRGEGNNFITLPHTQTPDTTIPSLEKILEGKPFFDDADPSLKGLSLAERRKLKTRTHTQLIDTLMPFMLADPHLANPEDGIGEVAPYESLEHTFSLMHRERAIYASALGINKRKPDLERLPLTYLVLSSHRERWQLGRLIETLNLAGTTRIAAMMGLGEVEQANEDLRLVEVKLAKIAEDMPLAFNETHHDSNGGSITARLIQATADLATASGKVTNGLSRRAERSRYYISQFENAATNLDVSRIEGFQPYNRLVDHLFGSAYRFIRMTGTRFERLEQRIREMDEQVQTAEGVKTQKQAAESQKHSAHYLKTAEGFAYLVLLPYYAPLAIAKVLGLLFDKKTDSKATTPIEPLFDPVSGKGTKALTVLTYMFAVFLLRKEILSGATNAKNLFRTKKNRLKFAIKAFKDRERARLKIKWRTIKNTTQKWRDTKNEISLRIYFGATSIPRRVIDRLNSLRNRNRHNSPSDPL